MELKNLDRIIQNPKYQDLIRVRQNLGWSLTIFVLFIYFGFIYLVAFHKSVLAVPLSHNTVITWSIPVGIGVIMVTILVTGIYVWRANSEFDRLMNEIKKDAQP